MISWNKFDDEGPWGKRSGKKSGGAFDRPSDFDDMIRKGQENFKKFIPDNNKPGKSWVFVLVAIAVVWLASGFYQVKEGEKGAVLRFGKWVSTSVPGINYKLPYPFEKVEIIKVDQINRVDSGMTLRNGDSSDNLMLTGDENIVSVNFSVLWYINDIGKYLFRTFDPNNTVKQSAESAIREVMSQVPLAFVLTKGRGEISDKTKVLLQQLLDQYDVGIHISQVQLKSADPPTQVVDAFRDVQRARTDAESKMNEARAYYNSVVPVAKGEANNIMQEAIGYAAAVVDRAKGETSRFLAVLKIHKMYPDVTKKRMSLDVLNNVLPHGAKIIIDGNAQSPHGVTPFLPLPALANKELKKDKGPIDGENK